jgi:hypothetical protein
MTDKYKWEKEYREGREAAQRGEHGKTNPYRHVDSSDHDMKRGYHWNKGWQDEIHFAMKGEAA